MLWFSGRMEKIAANILRAKLFGSPEFLSLTDNDKISFKRVCQQLGISTVEGDSFEVRPERIENYFQFETIVHRHLSKTQTVIVQGALGEAGMSLYKTLGNDIPCVFPYDCKTLPVSGNLSVIILVTDIEQIHHLEKELKELGIIKMIFEIKL